ncbi:hypothetical protein [Aquimonas voraii]|uniref:Uncharacterized protein n=1 Tax=Aquimonas voraii TaxID=265719 RepID=A0A1G6XKT7_9GAMM|nr:hypothetical protein [Aquimonas voraii]SDD78819.1 hypothetical protein SAMN04488509_10742 [Aquimonas voraii]
MNTVAPEEIRNIAGQVRAYVATLHARRGELRAERSQLEEERDALLNAPVNREDAIRFVFDYIDRRAARFTEICGWKVQLSRVLKPGNASGAVGQQYGPGVLTLAEINDSLSMDAVRNEHRFGEGGICFLSAGRDALADGDVSLRLTLSPLEARQLANAVERLGSHPQVRASASRLASALRKAAFVLETPPADRPAPPVVDRLEARIRRDIEAERGAPWPIR